MISTQGATTAGIGYGAGPIGAAGEAYLRLAPWLFNKLGGHRNTEQLKPNTSPNYQGGSFPGFDANGNDMGDEPDPYQYANFALPPAQTGGINPRAQTPNSGGNTPPGIGPPNIGGIGSKILKGLNSPLGQTAIGGGLQLIGTKMASNQMNKANQINQTNSDRSYQMAQDEKRRRDALIRMLMPMLAQGMQVNDPAKVQQMVGQ